MRTLEQIQEQVIGLRSMKLTLPEYSMFGDNNWEAIDAQINILEGKKSLEDYDEYQEEYLFSEAERASMWLMEDIEENLFE